MAFIGKRFTKVNEENLVEVLNTFNPPEDIHAPLTRPAVVIQFIKNVDGSLQYIAVEDGQVITSHRYDLEKEMTIPSNEVGKFVMVSNNLNGKTLKHSVTFADGKHAVFERVFDGNRMVLTISVEGYDQKAVVYYQAV